MVIQEPVQAAIWHCLNHYAYSDAIFLAERLYAEIISDEALFLLATCYYRAGKPARAYTLLQSRGCPNSQCRFLMAQCCLEINKLSEAEMAITGNILLKNKSHEEILQDFGDTSSFALRLLAKIYSKTERSVKAAESYRSSLKQNPFLWSAFESLCNLGEKPDPGKAFQVSAHHNFNAGVGQSPIFPGLQTPQTTAALQMVNESTPVTVSLQEASPQLQAATIHTPQIIARTPENVMDVTPDCPPPLPPVSTFAPTARKSYFGTEGARSAFGGLASLSPLTPSFGVLPLEATPSPGSCNTSSLTHPTLITPPVQTLFQPPGAQPKMMSKTRKPQQQSQSQQQQQQQHSKPPVLNMTGNTNTMTPSPQPGLQHNNGGLRRSSRLFNASSSVKENNKNQGQKKFASPKAPTKKSRSKLSKSQQELNEINKSDIMLSENKATANMVASVQVQVACMQKQSADGLMRLLQDVGRAYQALANYDCKRAIQCFSSLPPKHYNTGWVLCQLGRAFFELGEYQKAEKVFLEARQLEPHHMEGMDYYSTTLWHSQKEVALSHLAQELTELDKDAPESWIATGNCFSLQKEHDVAIKFFQRAVQVDADFAYAYTLLGHEYVLTEELDKAMACFRNATRVDPRHYNAWYGVGMIYYKQEKFALADMHFRKALSINPQSSVLLCHIGVVQHALKQSDAALAILDKAIAADRKNELCKFHRASILFANDRHKEALKELEELKEIVPKESLVYFLIGKVHKKLGNTHLALMNFSWAMDLDPKGANNQIKEAIDKRYVTEEDDPTAGLEDSGGLTDPLEGSNSSLMEADDIQLQAVESDESL